MEKTSLITIALKPFALKMNKYKKACLVLILLSGVLMIALFILKSVKNTCGLNQMILISDKHKIFEGEIILMRGVRIGNIDEIKSSGTTQYCKMFISKEIKIPKGSQFKIVNAGLFQEAISILQSESSEYYSPLDTVRAIDSAFTLKKGMSEIRDIAKNVVTIYSIQHQKDSIINFLNAQDSALVRMKNQRGFGTTTSGRR